LDRRGGSLAELKRRILAKQRPLGFVPIDEMSSDAEEALFKNPLEYYAAYGVEVRENLSDVSLPRH
jgi:hypothetical protein